MALKKGWKLQGFNPGQGEAVGAQRPAYPDGDWLRITVPADVHTALIRARRIPEPYRDDNVTDVRWVEEREWWFRTRFQPAAMGGCDRTYLTLEGLDTFATVWLNGDLIGQHSNMFRPFTLDVSARLHGNDDLLAVRIDPPVRAVADKEKARYWAALNRDRIWMRKCQAAFGWDWAPRLPSAGIRRAYLTGCRAGRILDVWARTGSLARSSAVVEVTVSTETWQDGDWWTVIRLGRQRKRARVRNGTARTRFVVDDPVLWWTHDLGRPYLYRLAVDLVLAGRTVDTRSLHTGIRTIHLLQEPDPEGSRGFTFVLNGRRVFAKGANWVPADLLLNRVSTARYRRLVRMAREAGMNMLRVWGGGIYEDEAFYAACDREGIMVWQDFMFSCAAYPDDDDDFVREVRAEARYVVTRLRNHPCIVLWCGNNENDWMQDTMYWDKDDEPFPGRKIYHELLPSVCAELDPTRPYHPSSPFGGNDHNSDEEGDKHNWQVWAGQVYPRRFGQRQRTNLSPAGVNYRLYARDRGRFISEFGIQACPVLRTLERNIPAEKLAYNSRALLDRIKDPDLTKKDLIMEAHTGLPRDLEEYEVFSMLVQAEGLKFGVEHYRRRKFACSGALVWQLNDCWPGISWSVIDYYLNPKAAYYYLRRAFHPLLLSFERDGGMVHLWMVNDTAEHWRGAVQVIHMDFYGRLIASEVIEASVDANASRRLWSLTLDRANIREDRQEFLYARAGLSRPDFTSRSPGRSQPGAFPSPREQPPPAQLLPPASTPDPGTAAVSPPHVAPSLSVTTVQDALMFFREDKDLLLPDPRLRLTVEGGSLRVSAGNFARFVHVDIPADGLVLSDNYFDLLPGHEKTVVADRPLSGCRVRSYRPPPPSPP